MVSKLSFKLFEHGFIRLIRRSYADNFLFTDKKYDKIMAWLVYVNDLVLTSNDKDTCMILKSIFKLVLFHKRLGSTQIFSRYRSR